MAESRIIEKSAFAKKEKRHSREWCWMLILCKKTYSSVKFYSWKLWKINDNNKRDFPSFLLLHRNPWINQNIKLNCLSWIKHKLHFMSWDVMRIGGSAWMKWGSCTWYQYKLLIIAIFKCNYRPGWCPSNQFINFQLFLLSFWTSNQHIDMMMIAIRYDW